MIYLFLIIVEVIVNLKNKPEAVEKVGCRCCCCRWPALLLLMTCRWLACRWQQRLA